MTHTSSGPVSDRLRRVTTDLRLLELELKSGQTPEPLLLQDFRRVLDNARMTAWTVSELLNARERQQDPATVIAFVLAERLRSASQLLKDLCADIEDEGSSWQTHGVKAPFDNVKALQVELTRLIAEHRQRFAEVSEDSRALESRVEQLQAVE